MSTNGTEKDDGIFSREYLDSLEHLQRHTTVDTLNEPIKASGGIFAGGDGIFSDSDAPEVELAPQYRKEDLPWLARLGLWILAKSGWVAITLVDYRAVRVNARKVFVPDAPFTHEERVAADQELALAELHGRYSMGTVWALGGERCVVAGPVFVSYTTGSARPAVSANVVTHDGRQVTVPVSALTPYGNQEVTAP
jgi:hypothetical protein